eukprot:TRINITY_DN4148_c0_g1_i1.p1 TRINITY_DN4148_c0_g1~~TRINITY_DN4148_c0_g1_i1.p1  ORF type:complete len:784 (-),score=105.64 TRINITY_DN4148_c0_g1_i1:234-2585(-)
MQCTTSHDDRETHGREAGTALACLLEAGCDWLQSDAWLVLDRACQSSAKAHWQDSDACLRAFSDFYNGLSNTLLALPEPESDSSNWASTSEACLAAATHAGLFLKSWLDLDEHLSSKMRSVLHQRVRELLVNFLESIQAIYDDILLTVDDAECLHPAVTGNLRLYMFWILFAAFGIDTASQGLLGPTGLLELTGNDVQIAVSLVSFVLSSDKAPFHVQLAATRCLADLTTADAAFLGVLSDGQTTAIWEARGKKAHIKNLTTKLNLYVNGLILAFIDCNLVDAFAACATRHDPLLSAPLVEAFLATVHNCLLYCSENQKRLRMHVATHTELVPVTLIPYVREALLPVVSSQCSEQCMETTVSQSLKAALQTFVVSTFNVGILREHFRRSNLTIEVLEACRAAGFLASVSWMEVLVKLSINVDLTLSPHRDQWRQSLLDAAAALHPESQQRLRKRLAMGGMGALPMSRIRSAVAELAPILGEEVNIAHIRPQAQRHDTPGHGKKKRRRRRKTDKARWIPKLVTACDDHSSGDDVNESDNAAPDAAGDHQRPYADSDERLDEILSDSNDCTCALTGQLLRDPLVTPEGHTYERQALEEWFEKEGNVDPMSGKPLLQEQCCENASLQKSAQFLQLSQVAEEWQLDRDSCDLAAKQDAVADERQHLADLPAVGQQTESSGKDYLLKYRQARPRSEYSFAPERLRCAIDGKLMTEPVRSQHGHTFERKTLERWVSCCGSVCPITSKPLRLAECEPDAALLEEIMEFQRKRRAKRRQRRQGGDREGLSG